MYCTASYISGFESCTGRQTKFSDFDDGPMNALTNLTWLSIFSLFAYAGEIAITETVGEFKAC